MRALLLATLLHAVLPQAGGAEAYKELDAQRIAQIAAWLPQRPAGFGRPIGDRAYWEGVSGAGPAGRPWLRQAVAKAEPLLTRDFPAWSDAAYLDYKKSNSRALGQAMMGARTAWLQPLVIAECVENRGRFLPRLNLVLAGFASQPSWNLPAHDTGLTSFHGTDYVIDLASSTFSARLANCLYLLGDRLDPAVRDQVLDTLEKRTFAPFRRQLVSGTGTSWWLGSAARPESNNWNAVCLSGVVGAAAACLPTAAERALFVAAGEHYSRYFVNAFHADGYCDEGGGYWAYGFGAFAALREVMVQATAGHVELFADPKTANMALFGPRYQLTDHLVPTFADSRMGIRADLGLIAYCNRAMTLGLTGLDDGTGLDHGDLATALMETTVCAANLPAATVGQTSWFDQVGTLVSRPAPASPCRMAVAIKDAGNSSHSHNDVGSFVITVGAATLVGDPGGPFAYNSATFGPKRFDFKVFSSYGHPVPVVAGQPQRDARQVKPAIIAVHAGASADEVRMDLTGAYDAKPLDRLIRALTYDRTGTGAVTIVDEVACSVASDFEEALETRGVCTQTAPDTLEIAMDDERLRVRIETPDGFALKTETIDEQQVPRFTRLGLRLAKPVVAATVRMVFTPAPGR